MQVTWRVTSVCRDEAIKQLLGKRIMSTKLKFSAVATLVLLAGCAGLPAERTAPSLSIAAPAARQPALQAVFALIEAGELADASRQINRLLARNPENAGLHLLNGFVYYRLYLAGDRAKAEHAETGLQLALQFDASLPQAHELLGLLSLDMRRFDQARVQFLAAGHRHAPENALALAHAAYYARDIPLAVWAIDQYLAIRPNDADGRQASAIIHAAAGSDARANTDLAALAGSGAELPRLMRRVEDWRDVFQSTRDSREASGVTTAATKNPPQPPSPTQAEAAGGVALARAWSDCAQTTVNYSSVGDSQTGAAPPLPALPSPCAGVPLPRMTILDVMMVRTEEIIDYGNGINLLTGLSMLFDYNWTEKHDTSSAATPSWSRSLGRTAKLNNAGSTSSGTIAYSLNIFSSGDSHAEVIARPTLIALDRIGSTFFSGSKISVPVSGQWNSSLQTIDIGISLSVTPTFIDDETMLLAVKTGRSFVEPTQAGNFTQSVSTSSNTVTASALLRFGETMVLSGLRERQVSSTASGVPVLNQVPIIQYLFNRKVENDYSKHILVLLTPRRPSKLQELLSDAERHRQEVERIGQRGILPTEAAAAIGRHDEAYKSNLRAIAAKMGLNKYYQEFKTGDLSPRRFYPAGTLNRILTDIRQALYY